jgi:ADP-ribose pyrophosphatase
MNRHLTADPVRPDDWELLESREVFSAPPWIKVLRERVRLPDGRIVEDYHRIMIADCVIVYAETDDGLVVVERQYKHGAQNVGLSLPAGAIDEGEDPLLAAKRELLEETGYEARDWSFAGRYAVNGNYGCGFAHMYLATGARLVATPNSGDLEHIEIELLDKKRLRERVENGDVHMLGALTGILLGLGGLRSS